MNDIHALLTSAARLTDGAAAACIAEILARTGRQLDRARSMNTETRLVATARPGTRNDTLNRAAFSLGQLAGAGLLPLLAVITALTSAAEHAGLPADEAGRTIRSGITAGARKPRISQAILPTRPPMTRQPDPRPVLRHPLAHYRHSRRAPSGWPAGP